MWVHVDPQYILMISKNTETKDIDYQKVSLDLCRLHPLEQKSPLTDYQLKLIELFQEESVPSGIVVLTRTGKPFQPYEAVEGADIIKVCNILGFDAVYAFVGNFSAVHQETMKSLPFVSSSKVKQKKCEVSDAENFAKIIKDAGWSEREAAKELGIKRQALRNKLLLNKLHPKVKELVRDGFLNCSQAREIARIDDDIIQLALSQKVLDAGEHISVRRLERFLSGRHLDDSLEGLRVKRDPNIIKLQDLMSERLGCPIEVLELGKKKGKIIFSQCNKDLLLGLIEKLGSKNTKSIKFHVEASDINANQSKLVACFYSENDLQEIMKRLKIDTIEL